jgi:hypothetical protein
MEADLGKEMVFDLFIGCLDYSSSLKSGAAKLRP